MENILNNIKNIKNEDKKNWGKVKDLISEKNSSQQNMELGSYWQAQIQNDIKHILFTMSRYKFAAKLLMYRENLSVLELGCNEAWGALMLQQNTDLKRYVGVDQDAEYIAYDRENLPPNLEFLEANFFDMHLNEKFDAIISMDVIEHIQPEMDDKFCKVITEHFKPSGITGGGVAIIGTPNVALSPYASKYSQLGHINLYDQKRLYELCRRHFSNVFIFNMNDEVVNTGFAPMACYIFAVCTGSYD